MAILKNPRTSQAFKKQAIKQIDPGVELYIKKLRQLPASLSVNADPNNLVKALEDEEGDLVTPIQQKILKRILKNQVTPKQELATTTPRRAPKREFVTPSTIPFKVSKKEPAVKPPVKVEPPVKVSKRSDSALWDELPFAEDGPEPDLEGAVIRTLKKMERRPRYVKNQPKDGQVGILREKERRRKRKVLA